MPQKPFFRVEYVIHGETHFCRHRHPTHRAATRCKKEKEEFFSQGRASKSPIKFEVVRR